MRDLNFLGGRCRKDQFACSDNKSCIPLHLRCNDSPDCPDESDEVDCSKLFLYLPFM